MRFRVWSFGPSRNDEPQALALVGRNVFDRLRMRRDIVEGIVEMHALVGWRLLGDRYARPPFPRGPDRSRRKSASAIRTYVRELVLGTVRAERALIAANACIR